MQEEGKGDGGISQGISGISPRGGLVNCSEGTEGRSEEGTRGEERRGEAARWTACGCISSGDRSESLPLEGPRGNERAESESGDTNHSRVTDLRRLTGQPRLSTAADAFAEKKLRATPSAQERIAERGKGRCNSTRDC